MGRSFGSVRMGVNAVSERWERAGRGLPQGDRRCAELLARMAKRHASACFYALDDPLEAALFSVLVELLKALEEGHVDL